MTRPRFPLLALLFAAAAAPAWACDLCGCYTPRLEVAHARPLGFYAGVAEQFTSFGTDRRNGRKVSNPTDQRLESSITQAVVGATFLDSRLGLQVNVPFISRSYRRPEGLAIDRGRESGVGDVSVLATAVLFRKEAIFRETGGGAPADGKAPRISASGEPDFEAVLNVVAGVKFPTGDSSRLREEFNEVEVEGAPPSGIHGHDLALGTGSVDGVFGAQLALRYRSLFFQADVQYTWRGDGRYSYRYANDFSWEGGPGIFLTRSDRGSLGLQCVLSGETKGKDTFQGVSAVDTGITSLYVGPRVVAVYRGVQGEIGVDFPTLMRTTDFQTTADYRLRAGLSIHF